MMLHRLTRLAVWLLVYTSCSCSCWSWCSWELCLQQPVLAAAAAAATAAGVATAASASTASRDLAGMVDHLSHMTVGAGRVLLAGRNRLLALDQNLELEQTWATGPVEDSLLCSVSGCDANVATSTTDNFNQLLLLLPEDQQLLSCGTVRQGSCWLHATTNLSSAQFIGRQVVANSAAASTVAFINTIHSGQGPDPSGQSQVLYVATTLTGLGPFSTSQPAIAIRELTTLHYAEYSFDKHSTLTIDFKYRDFFPVHYLAGFGTATHAYFLMRQKGAHEVGLSEVEYTSRVGRVCASDTNFNTYVEVDMECSGRRLLQVAHVITAGSDLVGVFGQTRGAAVLVAAFSSSQGLSDRPQNETAVCLFPLAEIDRVIDDNIRLCLNGTSHFRNLNHIFGRFMRGRCPDRHQKSRKVVPI